MLSKHIKKIEPIIEELKGKRIEKVDGVLIPEYLYSFPNGLWLSFDLDKRDRLIFYGDTRNSPVETGLFWCNSRYYSPELCRILVRRILQRTI